MELLYFRHCGGGGGKLKDVFRYERVEEIRKQLEVKKEVRGIINSIGQTLWINN